ncbi:hypothetical protein SAMN05216299_113102 [Nitrosospira sp. Nsp14]|nr:hypothetical protein SAMN05216299_113102 [Nitrosospira sp. Nsp14]
MKVAKLATMGSCLAERAWGSVREDYNPVKRCAGRAINCAFVCPCFSEEQAF